jgi:hypothetical protein
MVNFKEEKTRNKCELRFKIILNHLMNEKLK